MDRMLINIPMDYVEKHNELISGGDIRATSNLWLRKSYHEATITKVPRENQIRLAVDKIMLKKKIGFLSKEKNAVNRFDTFISLPVKCTNMFPL